MSKQARRFYPSEHPAPKIKAGRKRRSAQKHRAKKHGTHVNKYAAAKKEAA
jgi:hypothetical protein